MIYDLESKIRATDLSGYPYDGLIESYFDVDKYSEHLKTQMDSYVNLLKKGGPSDSEKERMLELRYYLKQIPSELAPELAYRFQELELSRKSGHIQ